MNAWTRDANDRRQNKLTGWCESELILCALSCLACVCLTAVFLFFLTVSQSQEAYFYNGLLQGAQKRNWELDCCVRCWVRMWCGAWTGCCRDLAPGTEASTLKSGCSGSLSQKAAWALQWEARVPLAPQPSHSPMCPSYPPAPLPASCAHFPAHPAQNTICSQPSWQPVHPLWCDAAACPGCDRGWWWKAKRGLQHTANPSPTAAQRQKYFGKCNRWIGYCFQTIIAIPNFSMLLVIASRTENSSAHTCRLLGGTDFITERFNCLDTELENYFSQSQQKKPIVAARWVLWCTVCWTANCCSKPNPKK